MRDLEIHRYIKYEQSQGRDTRNLVSLHTKARQAKETYRLLMREAITLPPPAPIICAQAFKERAKRLYAILHQKIHSELCAD